MVNTRVAPRENYKKDFDIPNSLQYADFTNTNFDRGHLVPASDMNSNKYYAKDAALITNIVPQFPRFNRYGLWRESERYGQELAKKYGEIIVIAGPLYKDENIRGFVIQVPSHYFKIFVYEVDGAKLYLAYVFPHSNDNNRNIQNYRKPLEEVKRLANIRN
jgi:endonuclease G